MLHSSFFFCKITFRRGYADFRFRSQKLAFDLSRFSSSADPLSSQSAKGKEEEEDSFICTYLKRNFSVPESRIRTLSNSILRIRTPERPDSVVHLLRRFGLSDPQIAKAAQICPQILFLDAEKNIEPKLLFFQKLGFSGKDLGFFLPKNSSVLTYSLDRRLSPTSEVLISLLAPKDVVLAIRRCGRILKVDPAAKLVPNISFLRDHCGIDGSQLSSLLTREPGLLAMNPAAVAKLAARTVAVSGCSLRSRMFVHNLYTFACIGPEKLRSKFELLREFGFSDEEGKKILRGSPAVFRTSEEKLRLMLEFFLVEGGVDVATLMGYPTALMYNMERRAAPRFRVLRALEARGIVVLKKKLISSLTLNTERFLKRYVLKYLDVAPELMSEYRGCFASKQIGNMEMG